jgi:hypothetical protein
MLYSIEYDCYNDLAFKFVFEGSKQWPVYRPRYTGFFNGLEFLQ